MRRRMFWNSTSAYKDGYLTFIALEDGTFSYSYASQYTIDDGKHWIDLPANTATPTIQAGNMISWRCEDTTASRTFTSSNKFNAEGDIFSMKFGENFKRGTNRPCQYMFDGCSGLVSAENLIIPQKNTVANTYVGLFRNCISLEKAPALPATSVAVYGYANMFQGCTSLATAPELPATSLASSCYYFMFRGCTSLVNAPALPATTLAGSCYSTMFSNCTSLEKAPDLPATKLATGCYMSMFYNCTSLTEAPTILPATTLAGSCYSTMFSNCTSLTTAPELPATTLVSHCYTGIFDKCANLNYIKCLAIDKSATSCLLSWVRGVSPTGTFIKHPDATWTRGGNTGMPANWTLEDAEI